MIRFVIHTFDEVKLVIQKVMVNFVVCVQGCSLDWEMVIDSVTVLKRYRAQFTLFNGIIPLKLSRSCRKSSANCSNGVIFHGSSSISMPFPFKADVGGDMFAEVRSLIAPLMEGSLRSYSIRTASVRSLAITKSCDTCILGHQ